jgi:hypothetical protein
MGNAATAGNYMLLAAIRPIAAGCKGGEMHTHPSVVYMYYVDRVSASLARIGTATSLGATAEIWHSTPTPQRQPAPGFCNCPHRIRSLPLQHHHHDARSADHQHCDAPDLRTAEAPLRFADSLTDWYQVYLAVFMELVSFPDKIQKEIVPVVRYGLSPACGVETHPL